METIEFQLNRPSPNAPGEPQVDKHSPEMMHASLMQGEPTIAENQHILVQRHEPGGQPVTTFLPIMSQTPGGPQVANDDHKSNQRENIPGKSSTNNDASATNALVIV